MVRGCRNLGSITNCHILKFPDSRALSNCFYPFLALLDFYQKICVEDHSSTFHVWEFFGIPQRTHFCEICILLGQGFWTSQAWTTLCTTWASCLYCLWFFASPAFCCLMMRMVLFLNAWQWCFVSMKLNMKKALSSLTLQLW